MSKPSDFIFVGFKSGIVHGALSSLPDSKSALSDTVLSSASHSTLLINFKRSFNRFEFDLRRCNVAACYR